MSFWKKIFGNKGGPKGGIAKRQSTQAFAPSNPESHSTHPIPATPPQSTLLQSQSVADHDQSASFIVAASKGDLEKVKGLLKRDPSLVFSKTSYEGVTALHEAAKNGHLKVVELLLSNKADPNAKGSNPDYKDITPLHFAAQYGHRDIIQLLLAHKADINARYEQGTPLNSVLGTSWYDWKIEERNDLKEMVKFLLANNADPNTNDRNGQSPLYMATGQRDEDMVEILLMNNANLNAKTEDSDGQTALHQAVDFNIENLVALFLAKNADVNAKNKYGQTPLHLAARKGINGLVEILLANNAEINAKDSQDRTPLHIASEGGYKEVAQTLLANKAQVDLKNKEGETPLSLATSRYNKALMDLLSQYGGRESSSLATGTANKTDITGSPLGVTPDGAWSSLQDAFPERSQEIVQWVESGGDIHWTCAAGMTLLHYAAMRGHKEIVQFLLNHGAKVDAHAGSEGGNRTPLLWACANIQTSVIPILLDYGADANAKDSRGYTPLQLIRRSGLEEAKKMAELLTIHGAKLTPGKTSTCSECGAPETVRMRERGVHVTFNGVTVELICPGCSKQQEIPLYAIDKSRGAMVKCQSCSAFVLVPPSVWCKICGIGLSTDWQKQVSMY